MKKILAIALLAIMSYGQSAKVVDVQKGSHSCDLAVSHSLGLTKGETVYIGYKKNVYRCRVLSILNRQGRRVGIYTNSTMLKGWGKKLIRVSKHITE